MATVDEDGFVWAENAGTAKITAAAADGSGKRAVVTINVKTPVSHLMIDLGYDDALALGKTIDLSKKLVYGSAYGKPSVQKADWSIAEVAVEDNDGKRRTITDIAVSKKAVSIKNGKLTANKNFTSLTGVDPERCNVYVTAKAVSADHTGQSAEATVCLNGSIQKTQFTILSSYNSFIPVTGVYLERNLYSWGHLFLFCDELTSLEVISSNPDLFGCSISLYGKGYYRDGRNYWDGYYYEILIIPNEKPGSKSGKGTLTVKSHDGSNVTKKISVEIRGGAMPQSQLYPN